MYPPDGDARELFSADRKAILKKHQMHKTVLDFAHTKGQGKSIQAGFHTYVLRNSPEDNDVFLVLSRNPPADDAGTLYKHGNCVLTDGTIQPTN